MNKKSKWSKPIQVEAATGRYKATIFPGFASEVKPAERIMTSWMLHSIATSVIRLPIRQTASWLNRFLFREESGTPLKERTIADRVVVMGEKIQIERRMEAFEILSSKGIDDVRIDAAFQSWELDGSAYTPILPLPGVKPSKEEEVSEDIRALIRDYNEGRDSQFTIKDWTLVRAVERDPEHTIYVSIDEVGVKHQKEHRLKGKKTKTRKRVENTVIHVRSTLGRYIITSTEMREAFRQLSAYLLVNNLCDGTYRFLFFSDGARNIQRYIETFFGKVPIVLDWYHLKLHMTRVLSMAIGANKTRKHEINDQLCGMMWAGNFNDAANYLKSLNQTEIRNHAQFEEALSYLSRKSPFRVCYALRHLLRYQNSSNRAEGANNLLVAKRQKHRSMSWSFSGSGALASITCAEQNGELEAWLTGTPLSFLHRLAA